MTPTEFNEWVRLHGRCVGGFEDWLTKGRTPDEQREVAKLMAESLSDVNLDDAKAASKAMMRGDLEEAAFGKHVAAVRRYARGLASNRSRSDYNRRTIDGHETVRCTLCKDNGTVECYHPRAIAEYHRRGADAFIYTQTPTQKEPRRVMPSYAECVPPCFCEAGYPKRKPDGPVYDRDRWIHITAIRHQDRIDELMAETDKRLAATVDARARAKPNFNNALAAFGRDESEAPYEQTEF